MEETAARVPHLVLVGRPNVGKSSLTNAMLGEARTIVSDVSGTTRDAVDVPCKFGGKDYVLIDTAGIRHRGKRDNSAEIFSVMRSEEGIKRADLCVLVIDASAGVTAQDRQIAGLIQKANKPCVVAINKWDLLEPPEGTPPGACASSARNGWPTRRRNCSFCRTRRWWRCRRCSGKEVGRLFTAIENVRRAANQRIGTGPLNRLFQAAMELQPPPMRQNRRFKLLYATQIERQTRVGDPGAGVLVVRQRPGVADGHVPQVSGEQIARDVSVSGAAGAAQAARARGEGKVNFGGSRPIVPPSASTKRSLALSSALRYKVIPS